MQAKDGVETFQSLFNPSLTRLIISFPYLGITSLRLVDNNKMAAMNMKWTIELRRRREDACLVCVKRNEK